MFQDLAEFAKGEALGATFAESDIEWQGALAMLRTPTERAMLRRGFIATYAPLRGVSDKAAGNRFDYLARKFAPAETSKRAKHTAERRGRKAKATAVVEKMSDKAVAARLVAILAYVSDASAKHRGDEEVLSILGDIARLANGTK